jgi:hypothetical protein
MKAMQHQIHDLVVIVGAAICYTFFTGTITLCTNTVIAHNIVNDNRNHESRADSSQSFGGNTKQRRVQQECNIPKVSL